MTNQRANGSTKKRIYTSLSLLVSLVLLAACSLPGISSQPSQDPGPAYTQAAETIIAGLTQIAPAAPTSTATVPPPVITETPTPSPTLPATLTETATATATPQPTESPGVVLFEDDFEGDSSWYTEENDRFSLGFQDDGYVIWVDILNAPVWSVRNQDHDDIRLEVDASRLDGPADGYYGLVCRHVDEENFYLLLISSSGGYGIGKVEGGEFEFLEEGSDQAGVIQGGDAVNRVRADCIGERLTLYANGRELLTVKDDDLESGDIGLIVKTGSTAGLEVFFDNFVVIDPNG
jgi:hypothetical protein